MSEAAVEAAYASIVAAARQKPLYADFMIPDTPLGRFKSLSAHLVLFLRRTKDAATPLPELAQEIVDAFIVDMDHSLRELGVGDAGVPKRMKKLSRMFYGRAEAYGKALSKMDIPELEEALRRNIRPEAQDWAGASGLAGYLCRADVELRLLSDEAIASGTVMFADAQSQSATP